MSNDLDRVSVELACWMKAAGWEHEWQVLDALSLTETTAYIAEIDLGVPPSYRICLTDKGMEIGWRTAHELHKHGWIHRPSRRQIELALQEMGLWPQYRSGPYELSGGGLQMIYTYCLLNKEGEPVCREDANTPADAVGLAWLAMRGQDGLR